MNTPSTRSKEQTQAPFTPEDGFIEGCKKDVQSITADWVIPQPLIDGVCYKEIRTVLSDGKALTEIYRSNWKLDDAKVDQVFQIVMDPGSISAWHTHQDTTDRLFVSSGHLKIVLYDGRQNSPTFGQINEFRWGQSRPACVTVPPGVWHGVQNTGAQVACLLNVVDAAYNYQDPDHWRLPWDTPQIPYHFTP